MIKIIRIDHHDKFDRRIYMDSKGYKYVDINLDDNDPQICTTCSNGEPEYPVQFQIVNNFDTTKRYDRIGSISDDEYRHLAMVVDNTKGMSLYGNRARVATMLQVRQAKVISRLSKDKNKSVGQIIIDIIDEWIELNGEE
jgi:hypothetical protein